MTAHAAYAMMRCQFVGTQWRRNVENMGVIKHGLGREMVQNAERGGTSRRKGLG